MKSIDWRGPSNVIYVLMNILEIQDGEGAKPRSDGVGRFVSGWNGESSQAVKMALLSRHREKWQEKKALDCKNLLVSRRNLKCADERDRIFGFCGLVNPVYNMIPDYRKTAQLVYCETTVANIKTEPSLGVLAYCKHPMALAPAKEWPTWRPGWSSITPFHRRQALLWDEHSGRRLFSVRAYPSR